MRWRKLKNAVKERGIRVIESRAIKVVEQHPVVRRGASTGWKEALDFRRKRESFAIPPIVERLLPQTIPRTEKPMPRSVPEREGKHPVEAHEAGFPPFPICRQ